MVQLKLKKRGRHKAGNNLLGYWQGEFKWLVNKYKYFRKK